MADERARRASRDAQSDPEAASRAAREALRRGDAAEGLIALAKLPKTDIGEATAHCARLALVNVELPASGGLTGSAAWGIFAAHTLAIQLRVVACDAPDVGRRVAATLALCGLLEIARTSGAWEGDQIQADLRVVIQADTRYQGLLPVHVVDLVAQVQGQITEPGTILPSGLPYQPGRTLAQRLMEAAPLVDWSEGAPPPPVEKS